MKKARTINKKLLDIIQNDFDGCEWFIIAANELMSTLNNTIEMFKTNDTSFNEIKDSIGKLAIGISHVEKCLDGVEECYNKIVDELSNEIRQNK